MLVSVSLAARSWLRGEDTNSDEAATNTVMVDVLGPQRKHLILRKLA